MFQEKISLSFMSLYTLFRLMLIVLVLLVKQTLLKTVLRLCIVRFWIDI